MSGQSCWSCALVFVQLCLGSRRTPTAPEPYSALDTLVLPGNTLQSLLNVVAPQSLFGQSSDLPPGPSHSRWGLRCGQSQPVGDYARTNPWGLNPESSQFPSLLHAGPVWHGATGAAGLHCLARSPWASCPENHKYCLAEWAGVAHAPDLLTSDRHAHLAVFIRALRLLFFLKDPDLPPTPSPMHLVRRRVRRRPRSHTRQPRSAAYPPAAEWGRR